MKADPAPPVLGQHRCGGLKTPSKASSISSSFPPPPTPVPSPVTTAPHCHYASQHQPSPYQCRAVQGRAGEPCHRRLDSKEGTVSKPIIGSPALCCGHRGKYLVLLPPKRQVILQGPHCHGMIPPCLSTNPLHRAGLSAATAQTPSGHLTTTPLQPHPVKGESTHTTHTILRGHVVGAGAQLEP